MSDTEVRVSLEDSQDLMEKAEAAHAALRALASADRRIVHTVSEDPRLTKSLGELELYRARLEARHARIKILGR
ncbi:hypothetical protein [Xanthomonas phage RTH11]|nr:hypothetical protein [Xanthomonas phage RTH11]